MHKILILTILLNGYILGNSPQQYPEGEIGKTIKLGEAIIANTDTHPLTKDLVGNKLKCVSCHLSGDDGRPGTSKNIGSFLGIATKFPLYKEREGVVETLQDRIDNCFMRSMDGTRPIIDSEASIAMLTYITWLSTGQPINLDPKENNTSTSLAHMKFEKIQKNATAQNYHNGKKIYADKCLGCHGDNGQGVATFPPLWGKDKNGHWLSYNAGAGMSKLAKSAAWIQSNMPMGMSNSLSDQESADVALYINAQERAEFDLEKKLADSKNIGYYNSKVLKEKDSTQKNFEVFGLDLSTIIKE